MSKYTHKRVVYVDSSQRISGASARSPHDFYVDMDSVVTRTHPMFGTRDPDVKIYVSVSQLYVPLPRNCKGVLDREPIYTEGLTENNTRHTPRVNLLRLHTNLTHNNGNTSGLSTVALQLPFMTHYVEADPHNPFTHAAVVYEEPHPESIGTFELTNGADSLGLVHFFLTDENNRRVRTLAQGVIHMVLTVKTESAVRKRKYHDDTYSIWREMLALTRLNIMQKDILSRRDTIAVLKATQEQTGREDVTREDEEGDRIGNHVSKKGRKFLSREQERANTETVRDAPRTGVQTDRAPLEETAEEVQEAAEEE